MKVIKFGQSTLKDKKSIETIIDIIKKETMSGQPPIVVVSSFNQVSKKLAHISQLAMVGDDAYKPILKEIEDQHFDIVKQIIDVKHQAKVIAGLKVILNELEEILYGVYLLWELSPRTKAHISTFGIRLSSLLLTECLKEAGIEAINVETQSIIKTNDEYGNAQIKFNVSSDLIRNAFNNSKVVYVLTGGIGSTQAGESSYLGKSGTSATAAFVANVLGAEEMVFYTDRDGIYNTEPSIVDKAFSLSTISYAEIMEMANFGNSFVYPPALQPAVAKNIPLTIKNLFNPAFEGTKISAKSDGSQVKANSAIQSVSLINVQGSGMIGISGVAARVFNTLAQHQINIVLIIQASSEHSICLAVPPSEGIKAQLALQNEFMEEIKHRNMENIGLTKDVSIVAVIGENMKKTPGIAAKIFTALGDAKINIVAIAQGSSEYNISIVIEGKDLHRALNTLHAKLF